MSAFKLAVKFATLAVIGAALTACADDPNGAGPKEGAGTLLGAGTGALIGSAVAGPGNRVGGAVVGGLLGGLIGNRIGAAMDDEDKQRAYAAQIDALERSPSGAPVSWKNPDSGRYGTVVPGPAYVEGGRNCRSFTHTIYIDGRPETARGAACRNPDGTWTSIG
ncbi:MAG TPA: RT0821/Lpp0805 family surface protein [Pseudolabrys sp.]|jgi:surface antigen